MTRLIDALVSDRVVLAAIVLNTVALFLHEMAAPELYRLDGEWKWMWRRDWRGGRGGGEGAAIERWLVPGSSSTGP